MYSMSAANFIKLILKELKSNIDSNTVVVGDYNNPLAAIDRLSIQKINKES
jgi:hypothetical protein